MTDSSEAELSVEVRVAENVGTVIKDPGLGISGGWFQAPPRPPPPGQPRRAAAERATRLGMFLDFFDF